MAVFEVHMYMYMWVRRDTIVYVDAKDKREAKTKSLVSQDDCWEFSGDAKPIVVQKIIDVPNG
jgi:hypothetical protein